MPDLSVMCARSVSWPYCFLVIYPRLLSRHRGVEPLFIHSKETNKRKVSPETKLIKKFLTEYLEDLRQALGTVNRWHKSFLALLEATEQAASGDYFLSD